LVGASCSKTTKAKEETELYGFGQPTQVFCDIKCKEKGKEQ